MKTFILKFLLITCAWGFISLNLQAQTPCDTLISVNGKKIAVRSFTFSKKEVVAVYCSEQSKDPLVIPIKQVIGVIQNGVYVTTQELSILQEDSENYVLVEEEGPDGVKTIRAKSKKSDISVPVEENRPPVSMLSKGRFLIGLTANTPGIGALALGLANFSSGVNNNVGIQISSQAQTLGGSEVTAINISPTLGFSPVNHILVGVSAGFDDFTIESKIYSTLSLNPFIRGYWPGKDNFLPFAEMGWHFIRFKESDEEDSEKASGFTGKVGTAFFLNHYISLDVFGAYQFMWQNSKSASGTFEIRETHSQFGFGIGFSVLL